MVVKNINKVLNNNKFIVTKEVEEVLGEDELQQQKQNLLFQSNNLRQQLINIKTQYDECLAQIADIDDMLGQIQSIDIVLEDIN